MLLSSLIREKKASKSLAQNQTESAQAFVLENSPNDSVQSSQMEGSEGKDKPKESWTKSQKIAVVIQMGKIRDARVGIKRNYGILLIKIKRLDINYLFYA